ncbi:uncharacterized protein LOC143913667 [Arctopsyche grandis]|uniref:uncharacterized protein LOC143913667 n=1 Tax=Arctopsyche grandis TaxID=121162 RepID=UPI00406D7303
MPMVVQPATSFAELRYFGENGENMECNRNRNANRNEFGNIADNDLYRNNSNNNIAKFGNVPNFHGAVRPHLNSFHPYRTNQKPETPLIFKELSPFGFGNSRENTPRQISNTPSGDLASPSRQIRFTPSGQEKPPSTFMGNQNNQSKTNQDDVNNSAVVQSRRSGISNAGKTMTFDKQKNIFAAGMRVFTGPVDKVIKWYKILQEIAVDHVFEVIARCVSVKTGNGCEKHILVRDTSGPVLQVVFYEIDFLLPEIKVGSSLRVMGKMIAKNRMKAFKVREVVAFEEAALPRLCAISHHMVAKLHSSSASSA